jgi:hypothetical protein
LKKTVLEIYALAVCFVTVVCFVVSLGIASYAALGLVAPEFTMNSMTYSQHQTNDAFWSNPMPGRFRGPEEKPKDRPNESDLTRQRQESYARSVATEQRDSAQTLVKTMIIVTIDMVVFMFHWHIARRSRQNAA